MERYPFGISSDGQPTPPRASGDPAGDSPSNGRPNVYRDIREAIVSGRFQPTERLVEADLAQMFGVGRTSVQAALGRLEQEGLVERQPHRGARVRLLNDEEAVEIQEIRSALEQLLARQAAMRLTDADLHDLREILHQMTERVEAGDPLGYAELDYRFHQRIWAISGQSMAARMVANLKSQGIRHQYRTMLQPGRPAHSLDEHTRLVKALAARDAEASEAAMRDHLRRVVETLKSAIARHRKQPTEPIEV